jgi:hypothetical protein
LTDDERLQDWRGVGDLVDLTNWLQSQTGTRDSAEAVLRSEALQPGFGPEVAVAYRTALKRLWRLIIPARPAWTGGTSNTPWKNVLAFAGIGVEAHQNPNWAADLSDMDAIRAARHGCYTERGYPRWMDALLQYRPDRIVPVVLKRVKEEWHRQNEGGNDLLSHFARTDFEIPSALHEGLYRIVTTSEPDNEYRLQSGLRLLCKLPLGSTRVQRLRQWALTRVQEHSALDRDDRAVIYLTLLFRFDLTNAIKIAADWIEAVGDDKRRRRAELVFGAFFHGTGPSVANSLDRAPIEDILRLVEISHHYIHPSADLEHEGTYSPTARDNAEHARGAILNTLLARSGPAAYRAALGLSSIDPEWFPPRECRRLAHQIAERDAV